MPLTRKRGVKRASRVLSENDRIILTLANRDDREGIYRIRHDVYAHELGQHQVNDAGSLSDSLDEQNVYLVARAQGDIAGFISITPPSAPTFSIEKYASREQLPFAVDEGLFEVRLLTVTRPRRGRELAMLLIYAALRWVETHGGTHIVAIGRREILDLYRKIGLRPIGISAQSGAVTYDFIHATVAELRERVGDFADLLARFEGHTRWQLNFPLHKPAACFHGGDFFSMIGERFDALDRNREVINADVLDAWFPPAPSVLAALERHLPWLLRTSPPTACEGLLQAIAEIRGVAPYNCLPGAGSSDLIFRALRHWFTPASRALILDPTYGEYAHVLERVIGCTVDRLPLQRSRDYAVELPRLEAALAQEYDLVVLVNPNSPTGRHVPRAKLESVLRRAPARTRIWVDETYVEYAGEEQSLERFAAASENVIVCKSMSKVYALSGARAAYLCAGRHQLESLRAITPPWVVSLPAQLAAVRALEAPEYYSARYRETHVFRAQLAVELASLGWEVLPGIANFLLCRLPTNGPDAESVLSACRERGLFLRNAALMGADMGSRMVRVAVKDARTNDRMTSILRDVCRVV
jgi:histidinol-phosphate/aromatic aminotransferase/cobyric acid decarboxylase-like protein